jgi:hypothetical protein
LYTALLVFLNIAIVLPTNYVLPADLPFLNPSNIALRVRGSKFNMLSEVFQNAIQWTVKGCMLLYYRLLWVKLVLELVLAYWCFESKDLTHNIILMLVAAYVVVTYIVQQGLYFGDGCHSFQNMWAVPARNSKSPELLPIAFCWRLAHSTVCISITPYDTKCDIQRYLRPHDIPYPAPALFQKQSAVEAQTPPNLALHHGRLYNFCRHHLQSWSSVSAQQRNGGLSGAFAKRQWE